jgi:hypothetical protein
MAKGKTLGLTEVEFCVKAIPPLAQRAFEAAQRKAIRDKAAGKEVREAVLGKGIHVVFSGFNAAADAEFPTSKATVIRKGMAKEVTGAQAVTAIAERAGAVKMVPCKRGAMLYLAKDAPEHGSDVGGTLDLIK